jgi:hypothetical protein
MEALKRRQTMEVLLESNHGSYRLPGDPDEDIRQVLQRHGIPESAVWTYYTEAYEGVAGAHGARRVHFVPSVTPLREAALTGRTIYARVTRNINIPALLGIETTSVREVSDPTTEWTFPGVADGAFGRTIAQLSAEECLQVVRDSVDGVLAKWPEPGSARFVVGTSGGGDSNILLSALLESAHVDAADLFPVMMLGIPDWDTQVENARELCASLGVELAVLEGDQAATLAGLIPFDDVKKIFTSIYPDADLEFLGTWLLRRVLSAYARSVDCSAVAFGANREDIISEGLARLARGLAPLRTPYRRIGDTTILYPMYRVPKKIGDGAYPTYSLENYEARNPSFSPGRSVYYYLAYSLPSLAPGIDVTLLDGFEKLALSSGDAYVYDAEELEFYVKDSFTEGQRQRWREFLHAVRQG